MSNNTDGPTGQDRSDKAIAFVRDICNQTLYGPLPSTTAFRLMEHASVLAHDVAALRARIDRALRLLKATVAFSPDILTTPRSNIDAAIAELETE